MKVVRYFKKRKELQAEASLQRLEEQQKQELNRLEGQIAEKKDALFTRHIDALRRLNAKEGTISFLDIILAAQNETHPLEYKVVQHHDIYRIVHLSRGKASPNPYLIEVSLHPNCCFLTVTKRGTKEPLVVLYFDKITNRYSESVWHIEMDFAHHHNVRHFLYELIRHVKDDTLSIHDRYVSERKEDRRRFDIEKEENRWFADEMQALKKEETESKREIEYRYEQELAPFRQQLRLEPKTDWTYEVLKEEGEGEAAKKTVDFFQMGAFRQQMNDLYFRLQYVIQHAHQFSAEELFRIRQLHEQDMQWICRLYDDLPEAEQEKEEQRFRNLLANVEAKVSYWESLLQKEEHWQYENRMRVLERRYNDASSASE